MFKKLGTQIVFITSLCIIIVVALMLTVSIIQFRSYNDSIMLERAASGPAVDMVLTENQDPGDFVLFGEREKPVHRHRMIRNHLRPGEMHFIFRTVNDDRYFQILNETYGRFIHICF